VGASRAGRKDGGVDVCNRPGKFQVGWALAGPVRRPVAYAAVLWLLAGRAVAVQQPEAASAVVRSSYGSVLLLAAHGQICLVLR
jgi:hypothetical protein